MDRAYKFLKNIFSILITAAVCGCVGAFFYKSVAFVTEIRSMNPLLFYLLPFAGLISVFIYRRLRVYRVGTIDVLESINLGTPLPARVAPAIFCGTAISHLFGASCGKEGAALQLGASVSVVTAKIFRLSEKEKNMLTACGMSALFSAVFGTPFGAAVFGTEVTGLSKDRLKERSFWLIPCLVSSLISWKISSALGTHGESFEVSTVPALSFEAVVKTALLALAAAITAYIFYKGLHISEHIAQKRISNPYLRIFIGGCLVVILTVLSGTTAFNGGGIEIIDSIFEGSDPPFCAFAYKILFTCISVAFGYKGGEIVPTLYVGATLGSVLSGAVGLESTFCGAVGITGLFAAMTKCPVASVLIACEMFGAEGIAYYILTVAVCTFLSGKGSLYIKNKQKKGAV